LHPTCSRFIPVRDIVSAPQGTFSGTRFSRFAMGGRTFLSSNPCGEPLAGLPLLSIIIAQSEYKNVIFALLVAFNGFFGN